MLNFGLMMGAILFIAGAATYVFAPRVGPNPIFGVRVGYSYASRAVWDKSNRFGGALLAAIGVLLLVLALILWGLGIAEQPGVAILTGVMFVTLLGSVVVMFVYARRLALGEPIARAIAPVKFRWAYITPVLVTFLILIALLAYFYPLLPQARMATHFNINEQPNGWMSRASFVEMIVGLGLLMLAINVGVVLLATREPLVAFGRWGAHWQIDPARGLTYMSIAFALTNLIILAATADTIAFNLRGAHLFPLSLFLWMLIPFIAILIALFFVLARRKV
ncbi:MAG: SdpI family protein [Chloroflexi bacterium]|nr:SdpI family protein [Chloroflexota bacterium]